MQITNSHSAGADVAVEKFVQATPMLHKLARIRLQSLLTTYISSCIVLCVLVFIGCSAGQDVPYKRSRLYLVGADLFIKPLSILNDNNVAL